MILSTARKYKPWLDTELCRTWEIKGLAKLLLGKHMFAETDGIVRTPDPDNDRDHCKW